MRPLKALLLVIAAPILLSTHVSTTPERPAANASHNEDLYVANYGVVLRYDASSLEFEGVFVSGGGGFLYKPTDLAFGPDGRLYVSSLGGSEIRRYDASGNLADIFVPAYRGGLGGPAGIAFGPDNHLYVVSGFGRVMRYDGATGSPLGSAAAPDDATLTVGSWGNMFDLAFGPDGDIYVSGWNQVIRFGRDGGFKEIFVRPQNNAGLSYATSLAFNPVDGNLYVASTYTDEVKVFYGPGSPNAGTPIGSRCTDRMDSGETCRLQRRHRWCPEPRSTSRRAWHLAPRAHRDSTSPTWEHTRSCAIPTSPGRSSAHPLDSRRVKARPAGWTVPSI